MVNLESERMWLLGLDREQLSLCLTDNPRLAQALDLQIDPEVFSDESRQAIGIKSTRMLLVDSSLHPWYTYFLLVRKADRRVLGVCGFKGAPSPYGSVEVGYAIHENYRNQGYMTEAVRSLIDWAFTHDTCTRVTAETLKENFASQRVLQKAGMVLERSIENMLYWKIEKGNTQTGSEAIARHA